MTDEQLAAEIREANLTYMMLAQNLIRKDKVEAQFRLGLSEGGRIIPVTFATFGLAMANPLVWVAHPAVISFLQSVVLIASVFATVVLTQKIAQQSFWKLLPQHLAGVAIALLMGSVITGW